MSIFQVLQNKLYGSGIVRLRIPVTALALSVWFMSPAIIPGAGAAYAQNTNATIRGQALDPSGAVVSGAHVVIVNQDTGVTVFNGKSDSAGAFVAPQVIPGTYRITVSAPGLKQAIVENLVATVAQTNSVNVNLQIGETTETI